MNAQTPSVNTFSVAPLRNVTILTELTMKLTGRDLGLPGMGCFSGPSGYGKSVAVMYVANKCRAYSVQANSDWTRRHMCKVILREMGMLAKGTIPELIETIGRELGASRRPLIIDEADALVTKGLIETVRSIYNETGETGTIILVGEEQLPRALEDWERVHSRMQIGMRLAEPCSLADTLHLASRRCAGITVAENLLQRVHKDAKGSARRVAGMLSDIRQIACDADLIQIDHETFLELGGQFNVGTSPTRGH